MKKSIGVNGWTLKIFAIITMTMNHVGHVVSGMVPGWVETALIGVGGATYVIMAYLLTEGYRHTRSVGRYILRLALFAALAQPAYSLYPGRLANFNVLFTLLLSLIAIHASVRARWTALKVLVVALCVFLSGYCDWGYIGVVIALVYFWIPDRRSGALAVFGITMIEMGAPALAYLLKGNSRYINSIAYTFIGCLAGALGVMLYNGERGGPEKRGFVSRYFFYFYYPLHLVAIALAMDWLAGMPLKFTWPYPFG